MRKQLDPIVISERVQTFNGYRFTRHKAHGKESWKDREYIEYARKMCGTAFPSRHTAGIGYCHLNCKMAAYRQSHGENFYGFAKCAVCKKVFDKKKKSPYCGKWCVETHRKRRLSGEYKLL